MNNEEKLFVEKSIEVSTELGAFVRFAEAADLADSELLLKQLRTIHSEVVQILGLFCRKVVHGGSNES